MKCYPQVSRDVGSSQDAGRSREEDGEHWKEGLTFSKIWSKIL